MDLYKRVKDLCHYDDVKKILRYYECPESCGAWCCKRENVVIMENDYRRLQKVDKSLNLEPVRVGPLNEYELLKPCSFLDENSRCKAERVKPVNCRMYPFKILGIENVDMGAITLDSCPMGFEVAKDYVRFLEEVFYPNLEESEREGFMEENRRGLEIMEESSKKQVPIGEMVKSMSIPFEFLGGFVQWLKANKKK